MLRVSNLGQSGEISPADQGCFKEFFDLSPDLTWIIADNRIVECNEAAIKTLGYASRDGFLKVHPAQLSPLRQPDGEDSYVLAKRMMAIAKDSSTNCRKYIAFSTSPTYWTLKICLPITVYIKWGVINERK